MGATTAPSPVLPPGTYLPPTVRSVEGVFKDGSSLEELKLQNIFPLSIVKASILDYSQSLQPKQLIFGGLKEKHLIYIFTKPFFISPSFT